MNKKALLPLALLFVAASFTGCSHQTTRTGSKANYGLGLVEIERGSYAHAPATTIDASINEHFGNSGKVSDTQTKILWGLFTLSDY